MTGLRSVWCVFYTIPPSLSIHMNAHTQTSPSQCYDAPTSHQVAIFIPPPLDASPPIPAAALTVFPDGWGSFDEILLSALVLERKRSLEP